jgi:cytochrome c553
MMARLLRAAERVLAIAVALLFAFRGRPAPTPPAETDVRPAGRDAGLWHLAIRWGFRAAVVLGAMGTLGAIVVLSGVVPIKASSGHWTITKRFLEFSKRRSVATHSLGITAPPLDDRRLVLRGAGQYDYACRPCHGSPSFDQPRVASRMTPTPPDLRESVRKYDDPALFYIVKHGIKLTGMPAWPSQQRDDEVWAMVAFLRTLPGLDAAAYDALARGPVDESPRVPIEALVAPSQVPEAVTDSCARCHGVDGLGRGAFPVLAGQHAAYLRASLDAYLKGERHSGIMEPVAASLGPDEMQEIAEYYSSLEAAPPLAAPGDADVDRGRRIAERGLPEKLVPACMSCHGEHEIRRNPHYPKLAGQYAEYIRQQLRVFRDRKRGGTPYHHIMQRVATQLSDDDIRDVAAYLASLPAPGGR